MGIWLLRGESLIERKIVGPDVLFNMAVTYRRVDTKSQSWNTRKAPCLSPLAVILARELVPW